MAITYLPSKLIKRMTPDKLVKKLITNKLTINKATLTMLERSSILSKGMTRDVALKVISGYKKRFREERKAGLSVKDALAETLQGKRNLIKRVQDLVILQISESIREAYHGEFYEWLPSDAETPDPLHQLNYGKRFRVGRGEMPGDRIGCRCGMRILTDDEELELGDD